MSDTLGTGFVEISADLSELRRGFAQARGETTKFVSSFGGIGGSLGKTLLGGFSDKIGGGTLGRSLISGLGTAAVSGAALTAGVAIGGVMAAAIGAAIVGKVGSSLYDLAKEGVGLAASMQSTEVAFKIFLGDADKAKKLMADIWRFAATTPFEMPELTNAAKALLAYGESGEGVMKTLKAIGDVSSGLKVPIEEMAQVYGRARVQGRAFSRDLHELTNRGVPIIQQLAKQFGVADDQVMKLAENGDVGFKNIEQAFLSLSSAGGKFSGMMKQQSQITEGLASTLHDNLQKIERDFGQALLPAVESTYRALIRLSEINFGPLLMRVQAFALIWEYHILPSIENSITQMQAFSLTSQLAFEQMILSATNAKEAVIALGKSMVGIRTIPNIQATTGKIEQLRKELIDLAVSTGLARAGAATGGESAFTGDKFSPKGKEAKGAGHEQTGLQALGEQFRKMQELHNDPKLKVAEKQLAEAKETNRILTGKFGGGAGAGGAEAAGPVAKTKKQLKEERAARIAEQDKKDKAFNESLRITKGKGIPGYYTPSAKAKREAAAEAKKQREADRANSPLMKKRAELKAAEEARRAEYKSEQAKRNAAKKARNEKDALDRFEKDRALNEKKQNLAREMRAKGMYVPPDVKKKRGSADYEAFLERRAAEFFGGAPPSELTPKERGRLDRAAAQRSKGASASPSVNRFMQGPGFDNPVPERSRSQTLHGRGTAFDRFKLAQERQHQKFLQEQQEKAAKERAAAAPDNKTGEKQVKELETSNDHLGAIRSKIDKLRGGLA